MTDNKGRAEALSVYLKWLKDTGEATAELRQFAQEPFNEGWHQCELRQQALAAREQETERYRHLARGSLYDLVGTAEVQAHEPLPEGEVVQVYRNAQTGHLYVRRKSEFFDGRFEKVT